MTEVPFGLEAEEDERPSRPRLRLSISLPLHTPRGRVLLSCVVGLVVVLLITLAGTGYSYTPLTVEDFAVPAAVAPAPAGSAAEGLKRARAEQRKLETTLQRAAPRGLYIVVDRTNNRLYLMRDGAVELAAVCSAGSGSILKDEAGNRSWIFDTPRGAFRVRQKDTNPVWRKPDWAFIEEGKPIPKDPGERIEYGTLGEYALQLGDGYMIHGTLYERLLGRNVTHGCIRLGREDLRRLYASATIGTPVFIY